MPLHSLGFRELEVIMNRFTRPQGTPLVSICCLTYNHSQLIKQALNGFMIQQTNFPFEIIIHDDCSTDGTQKILEDFKTRNPELNIKILLEKQNQFKKTGIYPINKVYFEAKGKYIAECDGDDYWTDPFKLQQQFDFLEREKDYVMCHHSYLVQNGERLSRIAVDTGKDYEREDLISYGFEGAGICHCTKMWRNILLDNKNAKNDFEDFVGDFPLNIMMGLYGRCKFIPGISPSIYRRMHGGNSWSSLAPAVMKSNIEELQKKIYELLKLRNMDYAKLRERFAFPQVVQKPSPSQAPRPEPRKIPTLKRIGQLNRTLLPNWR